ncbi:MAG: lysophospholipid acyltransferase family protein [Planctomycetes bacterium]|nr:lysophospholipid acyltransferase family protein [Planctomycetota bacterium]
MNLKSGPVAWMMYLSIRMVFAVMQIFPINWNLRTVRILARIWPHVMPRHRRRAIEHLLAALGDEVEPAEIQRLADRSLESVAMFAIEVICLPRLISTFTWPRYIEFRNFDDMLRIMVAGRGAILVTGHYGPFELIGHLIAALGFEVCSVMRPLDNVYLNRFLVETRRTHGLTLLDKKGATDKAEELIRGGALLGFIGDQNAGRKGVFVDFFGRPASTYKSIGLLAMATEAPIVVGYARRLGHAARYEIGVQRIIYPQEWAQQDDPLRWITQTYTAAIEAFVREQPDQYLWIHRRLKSRPKGERKPVSTGAQERAQQPKPAGEPSLDQRARRT